MSEEQTEQMERNRDAQYHGTNLQELAQEDRGQADYLRELMDTDLSVQQKQVLKNLASQDFALANYSEAEVQELKAQLHVIKEKFIAYHPGTESQITDLTRAWALDKPMDKMEPLSDDDRIELDSFIQGVFSRVTRGKDMKQQEIMSTSISEVRKNDADNSSGGIMGRLKR